MQTGNQSIPDPLAAIPEPPTLREMIAEHVFRAGQLRQLLRLSLRRQSRKSGECSSGQPKEDAAHATR